jgi:hypothetical protein
MAACRRSAAGAIKVKTEEEDQKDEKSERGAEEAEENQC